jgi:hypothetical protein
MVLDNESWPGFVQVLSWDKGEGVYWVVELPPLYSLKW